MYKLLEKNTVVGFLLFFLTIGIVGINIFTSKHILLDVSDSYLFTHLIGVSQIGEFISQIGVFILILSSVLIQPSVYKQLNFSPRGGLQYLVVTTLYLSLSLSLGYSIIEFIEVLFYCLSIIILLRAGKSNHTIGLFFNLGFLYGLSLFIALQFIAHLFILLFSINIYGKNGWKDFWAFLIGCFTPLYLIGTFCYLFGSWDNFLQYFSSISFYQYNLLNYKVIIGIGILFTQVMINLPVIQTFNINTRKIYTVLSAGFFLYCIFFVFIEFHETRSFPVVFLLGSYFFSASISSMRSSKWKNLSLILLFLISIALLIVQLS